MKSLITSLSSSLHGLLLTSESLLAWIYFLIGTFLPTIATLKTIHTEEKSAYSYHLTFFLVSTSFKYFIEPLLDLTYYDYDPDAELKILVRSTIYVAVKIGFVVWLTNPATMGARVIYKSVLEKICK